MSADNGDMAGTRIVGIAGSLRRGSVNRQLLRAAGYELPRNTELEPWDDLAQVPPFNEDLEEGPEPPAVAELRRVIAEADAVLIATPEYNGSIPGQLKNALDWASRPYRSSALTDKPVAVIGASPSPGGAMSAQAELRKVLARSGADVREGDLPVPHAFRQLDEAGRLIDAGLRGRLAQLLEDLAAAADGREYAGAGA